MYVYVVFSSLTLVIKHLCQWLLLTSKCNAISRIHRQQMERPYAKRVKPGIADLASHLAKTWELNDFNNDGTADPLVTSQSQQTSSICRMRVSVCTMKVPDPILRNLVDDGQVTSSNSDSER